MDIYYEKLSNSEAIPYKAHVTDAGWDFTIIETSLRRDNYNNEVIRGSTGIALEIPNGYYMSICLRSSAWKYGIVLANQVGIIDSDYRGEIIAYFRPVYPVEINVIAREIVGKRVIQGVILPCIDTNMVLTDKLTDTDRGDGGFGSSGA